MSKRIQYSSGIDIKSKVALEALKGRQIFPELVVKYNLQSNQIMNWKKQLRFGFDEVFNIEREDKKSLSMQYIR